MKRMRLVALLVFILALGFQVVFAETGNVPQVQDSELALQDTIWAYHLYPTVKAAMETHHQTSALPFFDVTDKMVSQLFALQGFEAHFPDEPSFGYKRQRNVSLRKTSYGALTDEQIQFIAYFTQSMPSVIMNEDHTVEYRYPVPVSMLTDIKYAGTIYVNTTTDARVVFIISLYTQAKVPLTIAKEPYVSAIGDLDNWEEIEYSTPEGAGAYYCQERVTGPVTFINAISSEDYEAVRHSGPYDEVAANSFVVVYEASTETADVKVLKEFIHSVMAK